MTVVKRLQHPALAVVILLSASLACAVPVGTPPPVPPTQALTPTPTPLPTISLDYAVQTTAYVLPAAVNIRRAPTWRDGTQEPGEPLNLYLYIGDAVTILECSGDWCKIETVIAERTVTGWVYRGCLSSVAGAKFCQAR